MSDRKWAIGLSNEDFQTEYQRRFAGTDTIPSVTDYLNGHEPVYHGIGDEVLEWSDDVTKVIEEVEKKAMKKQYPCRGCGKVFNVPIARAGHERHCPTKIS